MLKPQGKIEIVGDFSAVAREGGKIERDSIQCGHCQRVVYVKPGFGPTVYLIPQFMAPDKEEAGAMCSACWRPVCLTCHADGRCHTWERKIEEMEAKGRLILR